MKILQVNSYYAPYFHGGADRSVRTLTEGLHRSGHDVVVATLAADSRTRVDTVNGVKVHYIAVNNHWSHVRDGNQTLAKKVLRQLWAATNPAMDRVLKRILEEEQPDVMHTHILAGFSTKPWSVAKPARMWVCQ